MESMDLLSKQAILNLPRDKEFNLEGKLLAEYINVKDIEALPTVQSQSTAGQLNDSAQSTNLIDRQEAIDGKILIQRTNGVEIYSDEAVPVEYLKNLPSRQPEPAIPLSWIENEIEWLKSLDSTFSEITAIQIAAMVMKWRDEQNETD